MNTLVNIGMYVTYALFVVALAALVFFAVTQFIDNIRRSKTTLYAFIALIVVYLVAYLCSSPTDVGAAFLEKTGTTLSASKFIGSGMLMFYILFFGTIVALLGAEVAKLFKK